MRGAEFTEQRSSPQTVKETDCVCTVDANQPVLLPIDLGLRLMWMLLSSNVVFTFHLNQTSSVL